MKRLLAIAIATAISASSFAQDADKDFCNNLKAMLGGAQTYFKDQKGASTSIEIRGVPKPYFESKVRLDKDKVMYIGDNEYHPEAFTYVAEHTRGGEATPPEMQKVYDEYKKMVEDCLPSGFMMEEKDKSNDLYLEDTNFKKLVVREDKKGKKVKMELYIYNQRELDHWVVEFHFYGIGKNI